MFQQVGQLKGALITASLAMLLTVPTSALETPPTPRSITIGASTPSNTPTPLTTQAAPEPTLWSDAGHYDSPDGWSVSWNPNHWKGGSRDDGSHPIHDLIILSYTLPEGDAFFAIGVIDDSNAEGSYTWHDTSECLRAWLSDGSARVAIDSNGQSLEQLEHDHSWAVLLSKEEREAVYVECWTLSPGKSYVMLTSSAPSEDAFNHISHDVLEISDSVVITEAATPTA